MPWPLLPVSRQSNLAADDCVFATGALWCAHKWQDYNKGKVMMRWSIGCIGTFALCAALFGSNGAEAAGPTWEYVSIGVAGGTGDSVDTVVSDDGTYCQYPTDFPIKANAEVRLRTEMGGVPTILPLNNVIAETYPEGERLPGDACSIWARFFDVRMSDGYLIEIGPDSRGDAATSSMTEMAVFVNFWALDFTEKLEPDGRSTCDAATANGMKSGASFQTNVAGQSLSGVAAPVIVGQASTTVCKVSLHSVFPPADKYAIAIGSISLPRGTTQAAIDSLPAGEESAQSVPPAPTTGPEWLEGVVVRQLVGGNADDSGIESLVFMVEVVDDEALVADETPSLSEVTAEQLGAELSRLIDDLPTDGAVVLEEVNLATIGGLSNAVFFDAPGAELDVGVITFWNGPRFQFVLISGRGDAVLTQLEAIALEWYERGGAGENGVGATQTTTPEGPRTEGLWAYLPLPGQLQSIPDTLTFDQEWVLARGS